MDACPNCAIVRGRPQTINAAKLSLPRLGSSSVRQTRHWTVVAATQKPSVGWWVSYPPLAPVPGHIGVSETLIGNLASGSPRLQSRTPVECESRTDKTTTTTTITTAVTLIHRPRSLPCSSLVPSTLPFLSYSQFVQSASSQGADELTSPPCHSLSSLIPLINYGVTNALPSLSGRLWHVPPNRVHSNFSCLEALSDRL